MEEIQKREIPCTINKLTSLRVGDPSTEFNSGCSIVDVNFPTNRGVDVSMIRSNLFLDLVIQDNYNLYVLHVLFYLHSIINE